ncbi:MAG: DUF502 domain-containing protein [Dehalococcoidia bacterium]|nr:DUF502 domain-containing protein [Dehalococcoidia bacterium]
MSNDDSDMGTSTEGHTATEGGTGGKRRAISSVEQHIQRRVMDGLFELVPLLVTIGVVAFLVGYADTLIRPLIRLLDLPTLDITIRGTDISLGLDFWGVGAIVLLLLFYVVGHLISFTAGRKIMDGFSAVLAALPVVRVVFGVMKQAMASISSTKTNFSRVVFIEWPREGMMALGFVTGRIYDPETHTSMVTVYVPTIPNPTSGNMAFVFEDDVIETNLNPDDAMKLVFSGGIVLPPTVNLARLPSDLEEHRVSDLVGTFKTASGSVRAHDWGSPAVSQETKPKS